MLSPKITNYEYKNILVNYDTSPLIDYKEIKDLISIENKYMSILLSEFDFLNRCFIPSVEKSILVYISTDNNISHLSKIIDFYPNIEYHIYNKTFSLNEEMNNVKIFNREFDIITDGIKYKNIKNLYLICNQTVNSSIDNANYQDMIKQKEIVNEIKPDMGSYLRFLIFNDKSFEYFEGILFRMIFTKLNSYEMRLYVIGYDSKLIWSFKKVKEQLNFFDKMRQGNIIPVIKDKQPVIIKNNFDYKVFVWVMNDYFVKNSLPFITSEELINACNIISM